MADNPFESMLPYQQTSAYKTRVLEVARLMMEHHCGITLPQVTNKMRQIMEINIKQLFEERNSPDLVGSKLLYLSTWRECLKLYNPGKSEFPRPPSILGRCLPILSLPRQGPQFPLGRRARVRVDGPVGVPSRPLDRVQSIPRSPDPRGTSTRRQSGVAGYQEQGRRASSAPGRDTAPGHNTPQPTANQHGPPTTLASPAVNKNKDSDDMKPNSNPFAARTSLPSPIVIKPPGTDTPQPKPILSLWDSLRVAEPSEAFPLTTPELSRGRGGDRGRGGRFQPK